MNEKEVIAIAKKAATIFYTGNQWNKLKDYLAGKKQTGECLTADNLPEYYPTYRMAAQLREDALIHLQKGVFPAKLFSKKSPNMPQEEFDYVKENYKQTTLNTSLEYVNTISRAWADDNWHIDYKEETIDKRDSYRYYVEHNINYYTSLEMWAKQMLPALKTADANGVIATKPFFDVIKDEEGNYRISDGLIDPQPIYYNCTQVLSAPDKDYFLLDETDYAAKEFKLQYALYEEENIWIIRQTNVNINPAEIIFEAIIYYPHPEIKNTFVHRLKGIPTIYNNNVLWQSRFSFVTDILDLVLINSQTHQHIMNKCGFIVTVMPGEPCMFERQNKNGEWNKCVDGKVYDSELNRETNCPACKGTGLTARISPLGTFFTRGKTTLGDGDTNTNPLQFISPNPQILEYIEKKIQNDEQKVKSVLHIYNSGTIIKTQQEQSTATGMSIDQKAMYAAIKPESDQMFAVYEGVSKDIGLIRYGSKFDPPTITYPNNFDFKTEWDYIYEIREAQKAGLPPIMMQQILERYLQSHFFTDEKVAKYLSVINYSDRLMGLSQQDILVKSLKGIIEPYEIIIHDSPISLLKDIELNDETFFKKDIKEQIEIFIAKAKEKAVIEDETTKAINAATGAGAGV